MTISLGPEVQERLGQEEVVLITERVDDVVLLIGQMIKMGLPEVLDRHIPRHWQQRGLSWGWTAVVWLAYILTEGDHRKVSMERYVEGMKETLRQVTNQTIEVLDFSDDRLAHLLKHLSKRPYWHPIERELNERSIEVYALPQETVRCDATTVSGWGEVKPGGLLQFGHSKDDPSRPQIKLMTGSLDPLGLPLATDVVSGEKADDGLYIPLIDRINAGLNKPGLLFVGDSKMSALATRVHIACGHHYYLSPLPLTGAVAQEMEAWISQGIAQDRAGALEEVFRPNDRGEELLVAKGYEWEREQSVPQEEALFEWKERVLVIQSPAHAQRQAAGLEKRLAHAQEKIEAFTPPRGRGKRQITEEDSLLAAINQRLKEQRVEGLLTVTYEKQTERHIRYVGPGRGAAHREKRVEEKIRYQILAVERNEESIATRKERMGWKAFVTNTPSASLSLPEMVRSYRNEYRVERIFNRLKSRLNIAPLFVKREDQIEGLTHLLTLGVRVLVLMEFVLRQSLQEENSQLPGLHPENRTKCTDKPTAERILKAFSGISLTVIRDHAGKELLRCLTPLSAIQHEILKRLGLDVELYQQLEIQNRGVG